MATLMTTMLTSLPLAARQPQRLSSRAARAKCPVPLQPARRVQPHNQRAATIVTNAAADAASTVKIIVQGRSDDGAWRGMIAAN